MKSSIALSAPTLLGLLLSAPFVHGAVLLETYDLGSSNEDHTVWPTLTNANTGAGSALNPVSGSGSGMVGAPGFKASFGLYSFSTAYSVTFSQTSAFDIRTVVFQLELAPNPDEPFPSNAGAMLSVNGGAYTVAADSVLTGQTELRNTFGADPVAYTAFTWQWDLSAVADDIFSVSVLTPLAVHSSATAASLGAGDSFTGFVAPVPEPSAALLAVAGAGLFLRRSRTI